MSTWHLLELATEKFFRVSYLSETNPSIYNEYVLDEMSITDLEEIYPSVYKEVVFYGHAIRGDKSHITR